MIDLNDMPVNEAELDAFIDNLSVIDRMHLAGQVLTTKEFRQFIEKEGVCADDFDDLFDRLAFQSYVLGDDPLSVSIDVSGMTDEEIKEMLAKD